MKKEILPMFTSYHTTVDSLFEPYKKELVEDCGHDLDDVIICYGDDIADFTEATFDDFDELAYHDYLRETLRDDEYKSFLIVVYGLRWDGAIGYKIEESATNVFNFDYEVNIYQEFLSEDGKFNMFRVSSHDAPMGADYVIIGLDASEISTIQGMEFDNILAFADNYKERYLK